MRVFGAFCCVFANLYGRRLSERNRGGASVCEVSLDLVYGVWARVGFRNGVLCGVEVVASGGESEGLCVRARSGVESCYQCETSTVHCGVVRVGFPASMMDVVPTGNAGMWCKNLGEGGGVVGEGG